MKNQALFLALAAALVSGAAYALDLVPGTRLGTGIAAISGELSENGFEIIRYDKSADTIEVYAVKGDVRHEVYIDVVTGKITRVESTTRRGPSPLPGVSEEQVRTMLAGQGYEIVTFERERRKIEVYAKKDGRLWEIEVHPGTGEVLSVEAEG
ncbi:PepSY domain-containing protein [Oceaniradius stylonematis]|uniref:PepSY domain-containing protein n=1 Tax=Oceaniradius stylonematis TaxID=2184161 RepID=A0A3A8A950_9HYPH|nr:PepSY domain-containing protein [Oceaniradius stylonematis]RKF05878.1 PepSY domain-containing protein [Oceaniradius stylonematis]